MIRTILYTFVNVLMFIMMARAISSWFVKDLSNPIVKFLYDATEPMVSPVRNLLQKFNIGGSTFDISFIVVYILLMMIRNMFY